MSPFNRKKLYGDEKDSYDPVSAVLDLLAQVKDRVHVEVDMEKGFLIFGFYQGFLMCLMETLDQEDWYRERW